ncbi:hypothetical protein LL962_03330 [Xanthomonas sp. NCPPB 1067]|nr:MULTISPECIES: hypothetical protein [Xanthomonas]MCC4586160.1 hypothetical protein [Xanthomonas sp. NCPPB 1067]MCC4600757.1 hypothetical protein [Xanthomonas melonis]MCD0247303.1 hypothetical protein [Xanthomonas melonis]
MEFNQLQLDYALLAANVYGAKSSVRTDLNTLRLLGAWSQIAESFKG